ncbi:type II secretion system F family protein [Desulfotignum balticum]|uniref:type II secretion system F family protein n=1 Tax=Desulfotignum balticum TaxID=115781 RepID=UPI000418DFDA|nr:type II secretion system F family protein [Desulfotignum balticum]
MALYQFKAIDENGQPVSGEIEADSRDAALGLVAARGLIPQTAKKKSGRSDIMGFLNNLPLPGRLVKTKDLILFTKQFKTMVQAGVSIVQVFQILFEQTENPHLRKAIAKMVENIREGRSLFQAFSDHPRIFPRLYCAMIRAGEESGALPEIMDRLIYVITHEEKVKNDIQGALRYPMFVLAVLGGAFLVLLTFVVPRFVDIFEQGGVEIPLPTRICMMMYTFLSQFGGYMLLTAGVLVVAGFYYVRTDTGRLMKDRLLMGLPLIGQLLVKSAMSRFSSIFSILQASGVGVLESLRVLTDTIDNAAIAVEFKKIRSQLEEGRGISGPLKRARYFPPMVVSMVAIGEESGNLDGMLKEISDHYDAEVEYATKRLAEALGPLLMVAMSAMVGFFILAIFKPMWEMANIV